MCAWSGEHGFSFPCFCVGMHTVVEPGCGMGSHGGPWEPGKCKKHPLIASIVFHYEFEFIHPFADGNGRIGRLWQTLILAQWQPLFAHLPVESLIHKHQAGYYQALTESTQQTDCAPFILFMLNTILEAMRESDTSHVSPQVTPQVNALLRVIKGDMSRDELQAALGLRDRKSFQQRYVQAALEQGLIEMTVPDKPRSRLQKYRLTDAGQIALECMVKD